VIARRLGVAVDTGGPRARTTDLEFPELVAFVRRAVAEQL
jgi:hypothetical protein